jgi:putative tryptophan/tyrosine transport system substrate-binding protein
VRRREFITLAGIAAAAWPVMARAQQPKIPVIGFIDSRSPEALGERLRKFRQGLKDSGYGEGENVAVEYRWAENQANRLPDLMADLVRRRVDVIVSSGGIPVVFAAKAATTTIPIVFTTADDPVRLGIVTSLARPGGNLTGINFVNVELVAKRLELLREMLPRAQHIAVLVNPNASVNMETTLRQVDVAARAIGLQISVLRADTSREIDEAFAAMTRQRPDALLVGEGPFLNARRVQLVQQAARHAIPTGYSGREYSEIGGLMSYGSDIPDAYRQVGAYVGRILKGTKPADMPVLQVNKLELVINAQTARMLGLTMPQTLLTSADEVIE